MYASKNREDGKYAYIFFYNAAYMILFPGITVSFQLFGKNVTVLQHINQLNKRLNNKTTKGSN